MAKEYFRQILREETGLNVIEIGIRGKSGASLSSCCQLHDSNGSKWQQTKCNITKYGYDKREIPIIKSDRGIYYRKHRYRCKTHHCWVDVLHDDFELSENDEFLPETNKYIFNDGRGIYKCNDFVYDQATFTDLWSIFSETGKVSNALNLLQRQWETYYEYYLSQTPEKLKKLSKLLQEKKFKGCQSVKQVISLLVKAALPGPDRLSECLINFGYQQGIPATKRLIHALSKLGSRWFGFDGTFKFYKGLVTSARGRGFTSKKVKIGLLTITDEFGNFFNFEILPKTDEAHEQIIPIMADCVKRSLLYGPVRDDPFQFCSDDVFVRDKNLGIYIYLIISLMN